MEGFFHKLALDNINQNGKKQVQSNQINLLYKVTPISRFQELPLCMDFGSCVSEDRKLLKEC